MNQNPSFIYSKTQPYTFPIVGLRLCVCVCGGGGGRGCAMYMGLYSLSFIDHPCPCGAVVCHQAPKYLYTQPRARRVRARCTNGLNSFTILKVIYILSITKTYLYNFDPIKPHFYIVKLGFTGVYIIFLISAQNIDCGYSLEPPCRGGYNEYPQSMF